eukprot:6793511-Prorocentrum_lima.AAC.1
MELERWMTAQRLDLLFLQETHVGTSHVNRAAKFHWYFFRSAGTAPGHGTTGILPAWSCNYHQK